MIFYFLLISFQKRYGLCANAFFAALETEVLGGGGFYRDLLEVDA